MKRIIFSITFTGCFLVLYSQIPCQPISILNPEEDTIGDSYYDLQTNASCQNRIYLFDDGTIGATWTRGMEESVFVDRGTGYNYFDGSSWQPWPEERIESKRTGWPSYAPLGETGELVVAHLAGADTIGLLFNKRTIKGVGEWTETLYTGPAEYEQLIFPRMVTTGVNHNIIHLFAQTSPSANNWTPYQGLVGALLYSRSTNGGETWDIQNQILPGMDSSSYNGFYHDGYAFAEPKENYVAFVVGSFQSDLFLMKSEDNGQTFEKTIIWDNPYDLVTPTFQTEQFFSVDGSVAVALDNSGMAHVVFGIVNAWYDLADERWMFDKLTDGVGYWNETMETFSSNLNALDPSCGPESELLLNVSLIGWSQDLNGNGMIEFLNDPTPFSCFYFSLGISSMVQLITDNQNRLFLVYSSLTETYNNGFMDYRRLWLRSSLDGGQTWGQFYHYDGNNPNSIYNEYAFPSCATFSDESIYLLYLCDNEPGINCQGSGPYGENYEIFVKIPKDEIVGTTSNKEKPGFDVSQNFPNPFSQTAAVKVNLKEPSPLTFNVMNLLGQKVLQTQTISGKQGVNHITIEKKNLTPGVYFYTVNSGEQSITHKMIIKY